MSLLVDKYRPNDLAALSFWPEETDLIRSLSSSADLPHLLFHGPRGAGKMTRVRCLLSSLYGASVAKMRMEERVFQTPSGRKIEVCLHSSNFHIEVNPSDSGIYDRVVVQEILKDMAQSQSIERSQRPFKVAVLLDADRMTRDAQHALRRTMERYTANIRFILVCTSSTRLIGPLRSRCLGVRVEAPTDEMMLAEARKILQAEPAIRIPEATLLALLGRAEGNFRRFLLNLESSAATGALTIPDWEAVIEGQIAEPVLREQSPACLLAVRSKVYELLSHCIPPSVIIKTLVRCIGRHAKAQGKLPQIYAAAAEYELRLVKGNKAIFHIEAFLAKTMSLLAN